MSTEERARRQPGVGMGTEAALLTTSERKGQTSQKHLHHEVEQFREGKLLKGKHAGGQVRGVCDLEFALGSGKSLKVSEQGCDKVRSWFWIWCWILAPRTVFCT